MLKEPESSPEYQPKPTAYTFEDTLQTIQESYDFERLRELI